MQIKLTPILPKPINISGIQQALIGGMRDTGERIREEFEDTVKSWNHQPNFEPPYPIPKVAADSISVTTETGDQIYSFVSKGTRVGKAPYPIRPHNPPKALAFPEQFVPKTFPGVIGSGVGFSGGAIRFAKEVMHPGVEPRNFEETIAENNKNNFKIVMEQAMSLAAKASGHRL